MIYITGDIHGTMDISKLYYLDENDFKEDDILIICGDFGFLWDYTGENKTEKRWLDWLNHKPWTTVFVDGNHECFPRLYALKEKEWCGGKVGVVRKKIFHLKRGEVYTIEGKKFFAFGGARSHDIRDGVLDPEKDAEKISHWRFDRTKIFRINGRSWWKEEMPSKEEMTHALENLKKNDFTVDYVITHDCPVFIQALLYGPAVEKNELTIFLQDLVYKYGLNFKHWYFGHHHIDKKIDDKFTAMYDSIKNIHYL